MGCVFAVFFVPFLEKGILDLIAHGSIIHAFTICYWLTKVPFRWVGWRRFQLDLALMG